MALPAYPVPHRASRVRARAARVTAVVAVGVGVVLLATAPHAQEATIAPIVIAGPGEKDPAALNVMAQSVATSGAAQRGGPGSAAPAHGFAPAFASSQRGDRFSDAAQANGAIVIPGTGEAAAPTIQRVSLSAPTRQAMPVVVAPAQAVARQAMQVLAVAVNPPASAVFDSLAARGLPPQLGPPRQAAPLAQPRQATQPMQAAPAVQPVQAAQAVQPAQVSQPAAATGLEDGEAVRRAALAFLQQQAAGLPGKAEITIAQVFPRGLAACTTLEPFMPTGTRLWGRMTVGVRCAGERPWTLYLQAKVSLHANYYTASRALMPGEMLSAADLVARDGDLTNLPQAVVTDPSQAVGAVALVRVAAGLPLRQDMLRSAASVTAGQTVRVVAQGQGFAISSEGSAMNNATPGQQVRVKTAGGQIVTGIVKDSSTVEIQL